jgi:hypothetical protein
LLQAALLGAATMLQVSVNVWHCPVTVLTSPGRQLKRPAWEHRARHVYDVEIHKRTTTVLRQGWVKLMMSRFNVPMSVGSEPLSCMHVMQITITPTVIGYW